MSSKYSTSPDFHAFGLDDSPDTTGTPYVRGSDALANAGQMISFMHVPSNTEIYFKAFITNFQETYNSDWASETVYGRADPIYLFRNTTRKISLGFKIPAASEGEAFQNLGRVQKLIQFLYPNYTTLDNALISEPDVFAQTISQSPMVRLKIMNLVQDQKEHYQPEATDGTDLNTYQDIVVDRKGASTAASSGLLGVIDNITVDHHLHETETGTLMVGTGVALPKLIDINLAFSPIHEHPLGWREGDDDYEKMVDPFFNPAFPYGINLEGVSDPVNPPATVGLTKGGMPPTNLDGGTDARRAPAPIDNAPSGAGKDLEEAEKQKTLKRLMSHK